MHFVGQLDGCRDLAFPRPMPLSLHAFRYLDRRTGRWVRARYKATRAEIGERYAHWELVGEAELRPDEPVRMFNPALKLMSHAELMRMEERRPDMQPVIAESERALLCLFLRRYVTWCARARQFARMHGAAALHREVCAGGGADSSTA
ncbi:MAG: hypothetical protein ABJB78_07165 [Betaproteobacteria bacterium]